jgi:hypothetical protein
MNIAVYFKVLHYDFAATIIGTMKSIAFIIFI